LNVVLLLGHITAIAKME